MEKVKKYDNGDQLFNKQINSLIQLENDISELKAIVNCYDETKENIKLMKQIKLIFNQIKTIKNELEINLQKLQQMQKENIEFKYAIRDLKKEDGVKNDKINNLSKNCYDLCSENVNLIASKKQSSQVKKNNDLSSRLDVIFNEIFELFFQNLKKNRLLKSSYQKPELILHEIIYKNGVLMESFKQKLEKYVCETIENKLYSKNLSETYIVLENSTIESFQNDFATNCQIDLNNIEIEKDFDIENVVLKVDSLKNEIDKKNITLEELKNEVLKLKGNVTEKNNLIIELKHSKHNFGDLITSDSEANQINMLCKIDPNQKQRLQKLKVIATKQKQKIVDLKQSLENEIKKHHLEKNEFLNKLAALSKQKKNGQFLEQLSDIKCDEYDIKCNEINKWVNVFKGTKNNILELTKSCGVLKTNVKTLKNDLASTQKTIQSLKKLANLLSSNNEDENHMQDIVSGDTEQNIPFKEFTINLKAVMDEVKLLKSELRKLQIEVQETNIHDSELISCKKSLDELLQKVKDNQLLSQNVEQKLSNVHYLIISIHEQIKHLEHIVIIERKTNKPNLNKVNIHQTVWNNVESPFSENNNDLIVCKDSLNPGKIFNTNLTKEHEGFHPKYKTDEDNYLFQRSQELNKTVQNLQIEIECAKDLVLKHVEQNQSIVDDLEVYKLTAISVYQKFKQDSMRNVKVAKLSKQQLNKALNLFEASLQNILSELLSKNKQILELKFAINKSEMKLSNSTKSLLAKEKEVNCLNVEIENIKLQIVKEKTNLNDKILNNNSARKKEIERHEEEIILANKMSTVSTELNTDLPIIQNTLKESNFLHNNDRLLLDFAKSNGSVCKIRKSPFRSLEDLLSFEKNSRDSISSLNPSENQLTAMVIKKNDDSSFKVQTKNLKDDMESSQHCRERHKETPNMEYLKNIIMKFITLPSGEEKCCLVPVIIKLLNLSLEEQKQMETVAKGTLADKYSNWSDIFVW